MNEIKCPNCGSENVQSCQMIYMNGTHDSSHVTVHGLADSVSVTKGQSATQLAQAVAPPTESSTSWFFVILFALITLLILFIAPPYGAVGPAVLTAYFYKKSSEASKYNKERYQQEYQEWLKSFVCHKCGTIFVRE